MKLEHLTGLAEKFLHRNTAEPSTNGILSDLLVLKSSAPTPLTATLYQPVACLILQGAKEVFLGDAHFKLGRGDVLVVSHEVPVNSRIVTARPGEPYVAVIVRIDIALLRGLYDVVGQATQVAHSGGPETLALAEATASPQLVDAIGRYLALDEDRVAAEVLAPAVRREIHFRLLMGPSGGVLRSLLLLDSRASVVYQAISRIRADYRQRISVPELAKEIGTSPSSLHKHFRAVTSTTPLQFQKDLRLLEARRLLITGEHAVSSVAYEVGYESPNQFSREYSRKYGVSPRSDLGGRVEIP